MKLIMVLLVAILLVISVHGTDVRRLQASANDVIGFIFRQLNPQLHHDYSRHIFKRHDLDTFEDYDQ